MSTIRELVRTRVRDQGDRPTCVAFAVSSFHELWCEVVHLGKSRVELDLSEEFLFYGCKQLDALVNASGTTVVAASKWLETKGQCREELHPYQTAGPLLAVPSPAAFADANTRTLGHFKRVPLTFERVSTTLRQRLPLVAVIELFRSARTPGKDGRLAMPARGEHRIGLHAILLVGSEADDVVFLNSWGDAWGEGGFGRFSSDYLTRHAKQLWTVAKQ